jgi:hypothetical protein
MEKRAEEERDRWFNMAWPMIKPKKTWREKWLAQEEHGADNSNDQDEFEVSEAVE